MYNKNRFPSFVVKERPFYFFSYGRCVQILLDNAEIQASFAMVPIIQIVFLEKTLLINPNAVCYLKSRPFTYICTHTSFFKTIFWLFRLKTNNNNPRLLQTWLKQLTPYHHIGRGTYKKFSFRVLLLCNTKD